MTGTGLETGDQDVGLLIVGCLRLNPGWESRTSPRSDDAPLESP